MCNTKFAKTDANKVERLDNQNVVVTVVSGPTRGKSYILYASKTTGIVGECGCSWGKRNGTTCAHKRDAIAFVAAERQPVVAPQPVKEESKEIDGYLCFA